MCSSNPSRLQWVKRTPEYHALLHGSRYLVQTHCNYSNENNKKMDYSSISISTMEASSMCLVNIESQRPCLP